MTAHSPTTAPDNPNLSDAVLLNHAWDFAAAADAYAIADGLRSWIPLYFLFGRSIELAIKAIAIRKGASENDLRNKIGHDLEKGLAFIEAKGFVLVPPFSPQERGSLEILNDYYCKKDLEYPPMKGYRVPQPIIMRVVVDRMIRESFQEIWGTDRYQFELRKTKRVLGLTIDPAAPYRPF